MPLEFPKPSSVIRAMKEKQELAVAFDRDVCRKCFQTDHKRQHCKETPVIACTTCFLMNVFTTLCCENGDREEIAGKRLIFRLAGSPPRLFADVNVLTMNIPALFDPGSKRSRIDGRLAKDLLTFQVFSDTPNFFKTPTGMKVPIGLKGEVIWIDCEVTSIEPTIHLALGADYFQKKPYEVTFENITLNSTKNWATKHHEDRQYVYNTHRGADLRKWLLDQGRTLEERTRPQAVSRYRQYFSNNPAIHNRHY